MLAELRTQHIVVFLALDGHKGAVLAEGHGYGIHRRRMCTAEQHHVRRSYADGESASQTDILAYTADSQSGMVAQELAICGWKILETVSVKNRPLHLVLNLLGLGMIQHGGDHHFRETVKLFVPRHEVGLAVNLDQRCMAPVHCHSDQALTGVAALQLGRLGPAVLLRLFPQPLLSLEQGRTKRFRRKSIRVGGCMLRRSLECLLPYPCRSRAVPVLSCSS